MRSLAVLTLSAACLVALSGTASAHVTVHGPEAAQGGFAKITFQVPTEKDIPTTQLEIDLPTDQPLAFVSIKPHAGWTYIATRTTLPAAIEVEGEKVTEAVTKIVWTANAGQGIKPGEFDDFEISGGFLPKADTMTFKALQTYSDGSVVRWIESGEEAEHPAPVLHLAAAAQETHHGAAATATASAEPVAHVAASEEHSGHALAIAGLAVGTIGLLVGSTALARGRRS